MLGRGTGEERTLAIRVDDATSKLTAGRVVPASMSKANPNYRSFIQKLRGLGVSRSSCTSCQEIS